MVHPSDPSLTLPRDIVVIGASAGGIEALRHVVAGLPADFPAAVLVAVHLPPNAPSLLPEILSRAGPLPAANAEDGEPIRPGRLYVAPPDRHLLVQAGAVRLSAGPRENFARPAVDPLFRSAAIAYGPRVIGVVLSGALSDGTAGLWEITQRGGLAVAQDPGDAIFPSMPHSAMDQVPVDHVQPAADLGPLLARLVGETERQRGEEGEQTMAVQNHRSDDKPGTEAVERDRAAQVAGQRDGSLTVYVCPECGGTLWQTNAGRLVRFRCHVGHVLSADGLLEGYTEDVERSLWHIVRTLEDRANLTRQFAGIAREKRDEAAAARYEERARRDESDREYLEQMLGAADGRRRTASAERHRKKQGQDS